MTLGERIKKVRKALDLTQQQFADRLCIKRNTVATYETGKSNPSDAAVILICKTLNVSEEWLRTGYGEMFKQTEESAVSRLCEELHASDLDAGIIRAYFRIDPKIRDTFMRRLLEEVKAEYPAADQDQAAPAAADRAELEREADEFAAMAREQFLAEKIRESQASSASGSGTA